MGKRRVLEYPPPCSVCGEEFTYSKAPYCHCLCGSFSYKNGVLRPVDSKRGPYKGSKHFSLGKLIPMKWFEYEESVGWEEPESEE